MAKRIVIKIGDVFCAELDGQCKRFFQYIAKDTTQLSSSVIRVFKRQYPMDYVPDLNEILRDEVEFYAHTFLRIAVAENAWYAGTDNAWYRVGKSPDVGLLDHILFRIEGDDVGGGVSKEWYIWHINQKEVFVGKLPQKYVNVDYGAVFPHQFVNDRMRHGKYMVVLPGY